MEFSSECLEYQPDFLQKQLADKYLQQLWDELEWMQKKIVIFGRRRLQPRLIAWYGDSSAKYGYSGLSLSPLSWHPGLLEIRHLLEEFTSTGFNSVLANAYRDGSDSMGWHRDDESELGPTPLIASVSLGEERRFLVRENGKRSSGITLGHGSLLIMKGSFQRRFSHSLPKTRRNIGLRINLTYRRVSDQAPD
ncbi:MAG: alpha-ketoglutarate-dependent dioxygenase AlkB [Gammaproteobacteria bacterium]|jgi:alkylated DNA repair dioxygenase AlkB|nr:alpha-ketoglutarate-dependent dioxygenase AlkB [Gammaproteobacteria bacterium]